MPSKRFLSIVLAAGAAACVLLSGCGGSGGGPGKKDPQMLFVNACSDGPIKFFVNDEDKSGTLPFKKGTEFINIPFIELDPQLYDVSVEEPDRSASYDAQNQRFDQDTSTILVALGIKNPSDSEKVKRLRFILVTPNRDAPIGNKSRLIFVHAFNRKSPFSTPKLVLKTVGDTPLFKTTDTAYGATATLEVDSGTYKFFGTDDPRNNNLEAKDPENDQVYAENKNPLRPIVLEPGKIYLVMAAGVESANSAPGELVVVNVPVEP